MGLNVSVQPLKPLARMNAMFWNPAQDFSSRITVSGPRPIPAQGFSSLTPTLSNRNHVMFWNPGNGGFDFMQQLASKSAGAVGRDAE
jgi:hypothetical protein